MHHLSAAAKHWIDSASFLLAGVAVISLSQAALIATILAGAGSFILACCRIYDRLKYGPIKHD